VDRSLETVYFCRLQRSSFQTFSHTYSLFKLIPSVPVEFNDCRVLRRSPPTRCLPTAHPPRTPTTVQVGQLAYGGLRPRVHSREDRLESRFSRVLQRQVHLQVGMGEQQFRASFQFTIADKKQSYATRRMVAIRCKRSDAVNGKSACAGNSDKSL
jgi:hypothetical protein